MVKNLLGVYNKNVETSKFQYKMSSPFYFNHTFAELAAPNWSLPPFFLPLQMQSHQECKYPIWKLSPFPDVNLGTRAGQRRSLAGSCCFHINKTLLAGDV